MKKTLTLLAMMLLSIGAMAQDIPADTIPAVPTEKNAYPFYEEMTQKQMVHNINEMNRALKKYSYVQLTGELAMLIGGAVAVGGAGLYVRNPSDGLATVLIVGGGIASIAGYVAKLCSYRHLKKIQIQGSSLIYKF